MNVAEILKVVAAPYKCASDVLWAHNRIPILPTNITTDVQCDCCGVGKGTTRYKDMSWACIQLCDRCQLLRRFATNYSIPDNEIFPQFKLVRSELPALRITAANTLMHALVCGVLPNKSSPQLHGDGICGLCFDTPSHLYHAENVYVYICPRCINTANSNAAIQIQLLCLGGCAIANMPIHDVRGVIYEIFMRVCV